MLHMYMYVCVSCKFEIPYYVYVFKSVFLELGEGGMGEEGVQYLKFPKIKPCIFNFFTYSCRICLLTHLAKYQSVTMTGGMLFFTISSESSRPPLHVLGLVPGGLVWYHR